MNKLLSIIIPVYKVEKYIQECIENLIIQLPNNEVEIIIVDDGSPDRSVELIKKSLANKSQEIQNQFIIIKQNNLGISGARNTGILNAKGEYIAFLDSDDILHENYLKEVLPKIKVFKPDIVQFGAYRFFENKNNSFVITKPLFKDGISTLDEEKLIKIFDQSFWVCWTRVFKKDLFENLKFPKIYSSEDLAVLPFVFINAKSIFNMSIPLYYYRFNVESLSASRSGNYIQNAEDSYNYIFNDFLSKYLEIPVLASTIVPIMRGHIQFLLENVSFNYANQRWKYYKNSLENSNFQSRYIYKKSNQLFYYYGLYFLYLLIIIKRIKK